MKYLIILGVMSVAILSCAEHKQTSQQAITKQQDTSLKTAIVEKGSISEEIKLPARLSAYEEVSIFPKVNGYVKEVYVDIGSKVSKGQLLMTLEAPEIVQVALNEKERFAKARAEYELDKENYNRLTQAAETPGAVSAADLSGAKTKMNAALALCNAAEANWHMQQTMIDYLEVRAPFSGVVTQRNVHPGALVSAVDKDKPMLELKDEGKLRLQFDVPENLAAQLHQNEDVQFRVAALPGQDLSAKISRIADNVNSAYRSERMEADIINNGTLAPGMYADVIVQTSGNSNALIVPKTAVVTSTERQYVLVLRNRKPVKVDVTKENETENKVEIIGALHPGELVVTNADDEM